MPKSLDEVYQQEPSPIQSVEALRHASVDLNIDSLDSFKFQYGLLPADHPVQKFIDDLVARLPMREGQSCKVRISPDWHENNAFAMKDGTIILSAEIVRQAESEEALLGVIAHERVHVYRAHHEKQRRSRKSLAEGSSLVHDFLKMKSVERGHEYEADLRGALKDLEEAGVNPMGYKAFLEKLAQREERLDVAHGGSLDRALNIAGAVYYLDFASLTKDIKPIDPEYHKSLREAQEKYSRSLLMYRPRTFAHSKEELADMRRRQKEMLETLDTRELALALGSVYNYTAPYIGSKAESERDIKFFQSVLGRFSKVLEKEGEDVSVQKLKTMIGAAGLIGVSVSQSSNLVANRKLFGDTLQVWQEALKTTDGLQQIGIAADATDKEGKGIFTEEILRKAVRNIIHEATANKVFGDFDKGDLSQEIVVNFTNAWAKRIVAAGTNEDVEKKTAEVKKEILNTILASIKNSGLQKRFRSIFKLEPSRIERRIEASVGVNVEAAPYQRGKEFISGIKLFSQIPVAIDHYEVELLQSFEGKSLAEIIDVLRDFAAGCDDSVEDGPLLRAFFPEGEADPQADIILLESIKFSLNGERIALHLLDQCFKKLPQFKNFSVADKKLVFLAFYDATNLKVFHRDPGGNFAALKRTSVYEQGGDVDYDPESEEILEPSQDVDEAEEAGLIQKRRIILRDEKVIKSAIDELKTLTDSETLYKEFSGLSRDRIIFLYKHLFDGPTISNEYGIDRFAQNYSERTAKWVRELGRDDLGSTFANILASWLSKKPFLDIVNEVEALEQSGVSAWYLFEDYPQLCGGIVLALQKAIEDNTANELPLKTLIHFGSLIANPSLRAAYERYIIEVRWPSMQFHERLDLVLPQNEASTIQAALAEDFLEHNVRSKQDVEIVRERLSRSLDTLLTEGSSAAGALAIISSMRFSHRNIEPLTEALLESAYDDTQLKSLIYEMVRHGKSFSELVRLEDDEDDEDEEKKKKVNAGLGTLRFISLVRQDIKRAEEILRGIYGLDALGKQVVLRELLATKEGVLSDQNRRIAFWEYLFKKWVATPEEQDEVSAVLNRVRGALVSLNEWQLMYFALQNALRDKIAVPPPVGQEQSWDKVRPVIEEFVSNEIQASSYRSKIKAQDSPLLPKTAAQYPYRFSEKYAAVGADAIAAELERRGVIGSIVDKNTAERERLSPVAFVKEIASRTGAIGVRFLQVLPQFVELDPQYEAEFASVYDSVKGQSKISAVSLLEREWPKVWDEISQIGDRVGGGSAVTVYRAERTDGRKVVLKVRNPNIEYHINETHRFAAQLLDRLAREHGSGYAAARVALDDIKEWILKDISFEGFLEQDQAFRAKHDGYTEPGFKYAIKVPESLGPASVYFSQEEEIEGKNLTQWDQLVAEGHDMKQVTSLLIKDYVKQILDGKAHSDVHIGNFRVTPDSKVAILDRSFFLQLSEKERSLITSLFNPFTPAATREKMLLDYVEGGSAVKEKIEPIVRAIAQAMGGQDWDAVRQSIVTLKQEGGHLPLNFTLLLKNFNSLRMISQKAGFTSLTEAFLYRP